MKEFIVKTATDHDLQWLMKTDQHVDPNWIERTLNHQEYLVAYAGKKKIGFLRYSMFWGKVPFMDMILVSPEARGQGVGRSLFTHWQHMMIARGFETIMTSCEANETEPKMWHLKIGFKACGTLTFGQFQPEAEIFLIKEINPQN